MTDVTPSLPPRPPAPAAPSPASARRGCWFYGCLVTAVLLGVIVLTAAITAWQVKRSLSAKPITPTELTTEEEAALEAKIEVFGREVRAADHPAELAPAPDGQTLEPVDEDFVRKPLIITEREINGLIANNTDLGDTVYVTLDNHAIKVKFNYPVDEDAPFLGGKTLRLNLRTRVALDDGRLDVRVTDVAVGGLPLPSAWLKGIKDRNFAARIATDNQAMQTVIDGIESLEIDDGRIVFMPAE